MSDSPVSVHNPNEGQPQDEGPSASQQKQMEQAYAQMKRKMSIQEIGKKIKHKIMVLSGKGGVGKINCINRACSFSCSTRTQSRNS